MNEDQYNFLIATFQKRFGEEDITSSELLKMSATHIGWVRSNKDFKSERDIPFDPSIYVHRKGEKLFQRFLESESELFLLLGEAYG